MESGGVGVLCALPLPGPAALSAALYVWSSPCCGIKPNLINPAELVSLGFALLRALPLKTSLSSYRLMPGGAAVISLFLKVCFFTHKDGKVFWHFVDGEVYA